MTHTHTPNAPETGLPPLPRRRLWLRFMVAFAVLVVCAVLYLALDAYRFLTHPACLTPADIEISIDEGATFDRVAWDLKKAGAITDVTRFRLLAKYKRSLHKIQAGEFALNTGWTPEQVLTQITLGKPIMYRLVIREGLTWWETAKAVEEQGLAKAEHFREVVFDPQFLRDHHIPLATAEGFLWPETYLLRKPKKLDKAQARAVASLMVTTFWSKTKPIWVGLPHKENGQDTAPKKNPVQQAVNAVANTTVGVMANAMRGAIQDNATQASTPAPSAVPATGPATSTALPLVNQEQDAASVAQTTVQQVQGGTPETALAQVKKGANQQHTQPNQPPTDSSGGNQEPPFTGGQQKLPVKTPVHPSQVDKEALVRLLIMASLVEKETAVPFERTVVAGVYANRLRIGMLLQCDPTIPYGIGEQFQPPIRRSQLQDKTNPYNTYQHAGLPPGPICSSGLAALKAANAPSDHNYLYFVATGTDGGHVFSRTINEHTKAVRAYRRTQGR